ncbi:PD40 domain-containing protein, partial [Flavobacteriales bacterium AH-315-E23]|nr:PD40 domain-containing protein [Flavobacteriales bacterium AH-315-E23]
MSTSIRCKGFFSKIAFLTVIVLYLFSVEAWAQQDTTIAFDSISADSLTQSIIKGFLTEDIKTSRSVPSEAERYVRRGEKFFYEGPEKYDKAIEQFVIALKIAPNNAYINFKIGECYLLGNKDKIKSIPYLGKAFHQNKRIDDRIHFLLGRSLHLNMDLELAIEEYEKYILAYRKKMKFTEEMPPDSTLLDVQRKISECIVAIELIKNPKRVFVYNLGVNINSPFPDYDPFLTANDTILIFTSRRENTKGGGRADIDAEFYEDVYESHKYAAGWRPAKSMSRRFNKRTNNAIVGISGDGKKIFMYRDIEGGNIYMTKFIDGKWSKPKSIKAINTEFHETSACFSNDEKTLYFVSNKPGGLGGHDIYETTLNSDGEWGEPVNMGAVINTQYDEGRVFMHRDGTTLYFSSKGHRTMGGYDIFMTELDSNGAWTTPLNIGYPINTVDDDISFSVTPNKSRGYYSSIKPNGIGSKDIYMVVFLDFLKPEPMENQEVRIEIDSIETFAILPREAVEQPIDSAIAQVDSAAIIEAVALDKIEFLNEELIAFNEDSADFEEKIDNLELQTVVGEIELDVLEDKLKRATDSADIADIVSQIDLKELALLNLEEKVSDLKDEQNSAEAVAAQDPKTKILNLNENVSAQNIAVEKLNTILAATSDSAAKDSVQAVIKEKESDILSLKEEIASLELDTKTDSLAAKVSEETQEVENLNAILAATNDSATKDSVQAVIKEKESNIL